MSDTPTIVAEGSLSGLKKLAKLLGAERLDAQVVAPPDAKLNK